MAIRELGLQIRNDIAPQLRLEYDATHKITIRSDATGRAEVAPDAGIMSLKGTTTNAIFRLEPGAVNVDAKIVGAAQGTGTLNLEALLNDVRITAPATGSGASVAARFKEKGIFLDADGTSRIAKGNDVSHVAVRGAGTFGLELIPDGAASPEFTIYTNEDPANSSRFAISRVATDWLIEADTTGTGQTINNIIWAVDPKVVFRTEVLLENGTNSLPSLAFESDPDTGIYRSAANTVAIAAGGQARFSVATGGTSVNNKVLRIVDSVAGGQPEIQFVNNAGLQFSMKVNGLRFEFEHQATQKIIAFRTNSVDRMLISDAGVTISSALLLPDGSATTPALAFTNDVDTGLALIGNNLAVVHGGTTRFSVSDTFILSSVQVQIESGANEAVKITATGTANAPYISFYVGTTYGGVVQYQSVSKLMAIDAKETGGQVALRVQATTVLTAQADQIVTNQPIHALNGDAANPSFSFASNKDLGMFRGTGGFLSFAQAGTTRIDLGAQMFVKVPIRAENGTAAVPAYSFENGQTVGLFLSGGAPAISVAGTLKYHFKTDQLFSGARITVPDGTAAIPTLNFNSRTNTGLYLVPGATAADARVHLAINGVDQGAILAGSGAHPDPVLLGDGSAAAPTYAFTNSSNTGMFRPAANQVGFSAGGTAILTIKATDITATQEFLAPNGNASNPAYSFSGDVDTGILLASPNTLAVSAGGTVRLRVDTTAVTSSVPVSAESYLRLTVSSTSIATLTAEANHRVQLNIPDATGVFRLNIDSTQPFQVSKTLVTAAVGIDAKAATGAPVIVHGTQHSFVEFRKPGADDNLGWIGLPSFSPGSLFIYAPNAAGNANEQVFSANGTNTALRAAGATADQFVISATAITTTVPISYPDGSAANPAIKFSSRPNTGLYLVPGATAADAEIHVSINGTDAGVIPAAGGGSTPIVAPALFTWTTPVDLGPTAGIPLFSAQVPWPPGYVYDSSLDYTFVLVSPPAGVTISRFVLGTATFARIELNFAQDVAQGTVITFTASTTPK